MTGEPFFVDRQVPYFTHYVKRFTDLPFLVLLEKNETGYAPGKFLTAADLGQASENDQFKTVLMDAATGKPFVPNGSLGFRFGEEGAGSWNLELGDVDPMLTMADAGRGAQAVPVTLPAFDSVDGSAQQSLRGVPAVDWQGRLVTTVFDLLLAQYGVGRPGLPGSWPSGYDDATQGCTPAWQEQFTSVPAAKAERIGREFAQNAEDSKGRSMILMGAGTNHWFHSDTIYRAFLALPA